MNVSQFIADFVHSQGVRTVFMLTGTGSIHLDVAFSEHPGLKHICTRHEAAAAFMAIATAKLTNGLGVTVVTSGPGGANAFAGLVEAYVDSQPLMVLSGQVESHFLGGTGRSIGVQGVGIVAAAHPFAKYAEVVTSAADVLFHLEKATWLALSGRPGPVWLDIPADIQAQEVPPGPLRRFHPPEQPVDRPRLRAEVTRLIARLRKAHRPTLVIGQGVRQAGVETELLTLLDRTGIPTVAARMGQDILPSDHPAYFGQAGIRGRRASAMILKTADLIIGLGTSFAPALVGENMAGVAQDAYTVLVDLEPAGSSCGPVRIDLAIRANLRDFLPLLVEGAVAADYRAGVQWRDYCRQVKLNYPSVAPELMADPINSYVLGDMLSRFAQADHLFVSDAGSAYFVAGQALSFRKGQREITSGCFTTMGAALPLAIGAAALGGYRPVVITGDGSIETNIQELHTLHQYGFNIKIFVINNGGYASIHQSQREILSRNYIDCHDVLDFSKIADAFGIAYSRIQRSDDLEEKIPNILASNDPVLVEVICHQSQEMLMPHETLTRESRNDDLRKV
jgi:acetolactate synthase I/II/III large subunit